MTAEELDAFEKKFIDQYNCPLNLEFLYQKPPSIGPKNIDIGNNILHFNSGNRPNKASLNKELRKGLKGALVLNSDSEILQEAIRRSREKNKDSKNGIYLEFGFCTGRSINFIAALGYDKKVFGFDSVNGLPTDWPDKPKRFPKNTFRYKKKYSFNKEKDEMVLSNRTKDDQSQEAFISFIPLPNTKLITGLIQDTLPKFKEYIIEKGYQIEFIHIDIDLYESCQVIYEQLGDLIIPDKTVVVLDEGYNWIGENDGNNAWENHEYKATQEFAEAEGHLIKYLAYNKQHQQLALLFQ